MLLLLTACCRVKQPKQKSPKGLSILQTKMMIGHSEFIAKTICQQPPLGATALNPGQNYTNWPGIKKGPFKLNFSKTLVWISPVNVKIIYILHNEVILAFIWHFFYNKIVFSQFYLIRVSSYTSLKHFSAYSDWFSPPKLLGLWKNQFLRFQ